MKKSQPSLDRLDILSAAIYPTRRPARPGLEESALDFAGRAHDSSLPLTRIFHPYEYWTHAVPRDAGECTYVSSAPEPDSAKSGWPAAPPIGIVHRLCGWAIRGLFLLPLALTAAAFKRQ